MAKATHTVMPHSLAKALMDASMQHFDSGGQVSALGGGNTTQTPSTNDSVTNPYGTFSNLQHDPSASNISSFANPMNQVGGMFQDIGQSLTAQNKFQASSPTITNQNFGPRIQSLQGEQNQTYGQQQSLAQQLLNQSQGIGPNPVQAALNQQTGQNVAQTGALMAGQRGAGANTGLLARQAGQMGANAQQQSIGQAATLQAQQQLAAQKALQDSYQNMANQAIQGESIQQGGLASQNSAITTGQLGAQGINANIAGQNAAAINGTTGSIMNALGGAGASMLSKGGEVKKMASGGGVMGIAQFASPQAAPINMTDWKGQGVLVNAPKGDKKKPQTPGDTGSSPDTGDAGDWEGGGGLAGGAGDAEGMPSVGGLGTMLASHGGMIPNYDDGGEINDNIGIADFSPPSSSASGGAGGDGGGAGIQLGKKGGGGGGGGLASMLPLLAMLAHGGTPEQAFSRALMKLGGKVPGKAKVSGDNEKNDTQPTLLSPGEVVLPRSVTQSPQAAKKAAEFMKHVQKGKGKKASSYGDVLQAKQAVKKCGGGRM